MLHFNMIHEELYFSEYMMLERFLNRGHATETNSNYSLSDFYEGRCKI
jgi:hypothetical protein